MMTAVIEINCHTKWKESSLYCCMCDDVFAPLAGWSQIVYEMAALEGAFTKIQRETVQEYE